MPLVPDQAGPLAQRIAGGHAWADHRDDFPEVESQGEFAALILRILVAPSDERVLVRNRTAYWDGPSGTIVIVNPGDPDGGACFRPSDGWAYFERSR